MSEIETLLSLSRTVRAFLHVKNVEVRVKPIDSNVYRYEIAFSTQTSPSTYSYIYHGESIEEAIAAVEDFIKNTPNDFNEVLIRLKKLEAECISLRQLLTKVGYLENE